MAKKPHTKLNTQAAELISRLQACRTTNSREWLEQTAELLTKVTGDKHRVETIYEVSGDYNDAIVCEP